MGGTLVGGDMGEVAVVDEDGDGAAGVYEEAEANGDDDDDDDNGASLGFGACGSLT